MTAEQDEGVGVIAAGSRVRMQELKAREEINGTCGTVVSFDADKGRYAVEISDGRILLLRPTNLAVVNEPPSESATEAEVAELAEKAAKVAAQVKAAEAAKAEAEASEAAAIAALLDREGCRPSWRHDVAAPPLELETLPSGTRVSISSGKRGEVVSARSESRHIVAVEGQPKPLTLRTESLIVRRVTCVVILLACHVGSGARVAALRNCLCSILNQTVSAPLHLSWSAETAALAAEVEAMLAELFTPAERALFHRHDERRSQFEHFVLLKQSADERARSALGRLAILSLWALFSDDDDVWHPQRLETYCDELRGRLGGLRTDDERAFAKGCSSLTLRWSAVRGRPDDDDGTVGQGEPPMSTAAEVDALLADGRAWVRGTDSPDEAPCEYWCTLVRFDRLQAFLRLASSGMLRSPFCDLAFATYLREGLTGEEMGKLVRHVPYEPRRPWLYAHNSVKAMLVGHATQSEHASSAEFVPFARERRLARPLEPTACQLFPEAAAAGDCTVEMLGRHVANARRSVHVIVAKSLWTKAHSKVDSADAKKADVMAQIGVILLRHACGAEEVALSWSTAFHFFVLDETKPMRGVLHELALPQADRLADAFEAQCATARYEAYEQLEDARYEWIRANGQEADCVRFVSGRKERAELNKPPAPAAEKTAGDGEEATATGGP